jgi:hypothetical protein
LHEHARHFPPPKKVLRRAKKRPSVINKKTTADSHQEQTKTQRKTPKKPRAVINHASPVSEVIRCGDDISTLKTKPQNPISK